MPVLPLPGCPQLRRCARRRHLAPGVQRLLVLFHGRHPRALRRNGVPLSSLLRDLASLAPGEPLGIDTETTGLGPYTGDVLRGISLSFRGRSYYVPLTHPDSENWSPAQAERLAERLMWTPARKILHNGNFDRTFMEQHFGRDVIGDTYSDTQVRAWLLDENRSKSLKDLGERYFGVSAKAEQDYLKQLFKRPTQAEVYKQLRAECPAEPAAETRERARAICEAAPRRTWATVTADEIAEYAKKDTDLTLAVHAKQELEAEWPEVACAEWRHIQVNGTVYRMMRRGVGINLGRVAAAKDRYRQDMARIEEQFDTGVLRSPKRLKDLITDWGFDISNTSRATLEPLAAQHKGIRAVLAFRRLDKAIGTYLDPLVKHAGSDGRIHSWINTCGTTTGRFSSSSPNMANIPRGDTDSLIHDCFVPTPGYELLSFDMSKAEVRIAASISDEPFLLDIFDADRNLYQEVAEMIQSDYQSGKMTVLSSNYRIGARKLSEQQAARQGRKVTRCEHWIWQCEHDEYYCDEGCRNPHKRCQDCDTCGTDVQLKGYRANVPFLISCMNNVAQYAEKRRRLPLHQAGRFRRFPHEWQLRQWKVKPPWPRPYQAFNSAVQGGNAEILKDWLVQSEPVLQELGAYPILTIYDAMVVEAPIGMRDEVQRRLQTVLDSVMPAGWILIPLECKEGI